MDRISIGVQSFFEEETAACGRPQSREADAALSLLADAGFATINIDLIYGLPGQTLETWLESLRAALSYQPDQLYLYPLYVRPLTGLGRSQRSWDDLRLTCYREARVPPFGGLLAGVDADVSPRGRSRSDRTNVLLPGRRHGRPRMRGAILLSFPGTTRSTTRLPRKA